MNLHSHLSAVHHNRLCFFLPAAATAVALLWLTLQPITVSAAQRPNVLFIGVDDMNVNLGCYGGSQVQSPNIDLLASRGMLFQRAYCQQALCNPSRASLLTGRRPDTIKVWDLRTDFRTALPGIKTLPQHFKDHGYHVKSIGKMFHNMGGLDDEASWSEPAVLHAGRHSDTYANVKKGGPAKAAGAFERLDVPDNTYRDGKIADLAVNAITRLKDKPFFLAVGFWRPHLPFLAPAKYWDMYDPQQLTLPTNTHAPAEAPEVALHDSREVKSYGVKLKNGVAALPDARQLHHGYYASISYLDAQLGKILKQLDRLELTRRTVVVFWSDHGFHLGEHSLWCKTSNFELDARVPLIVSAPMLAKSKRGGQTRQLVELIDIFPTLTEICGLPAAKGLEGKSFPPLLQQPLQPWTTAAYTQHPRPAYYKGKPRVMGYSMRTATLRYTQWRKFETGATVAQELYDHRRDPAENHNVAADPRYAVQLQQLKKQMQNGPCAPDIAKQLKTSPASD